MISFKKESKKFNKPVTLTIQFVSSNSPMHFIYDEILNLDNKGIMYVHSSASGQVYGINFNNASWWSIRDDSEIIEEENNNESDTDCE